MSDIVERLRYRRDYLLPSDLMAEAADEIARLRAELAKAEDQIDALCAKVQSLAPHGTCGCSYDAPDDVCLHHSPQLAKVKEERDQLEFMLEFEKRELAKAKEERDQWEVTAAVSERRVAHWQDRAKDAEAELAKASGRRSCQKDEGECF